MDAKASLKRLLSIIVSPDQRLLRDQRNVDVLLLAALYRADVLSEIHNPVAYLDFLRSCFERTAFSVKEVKAESGDGDGAARRFSTLMDVIQGNALPIDFSTATDIALIADKMSNLSLPLDRPRWAGDVGLHFLRSSTTAKTGRLLQSIIRFCRVEQCLELGTAYGMSALFMLSALKAKGDSGHLTTLEGSEPQFSLASTTLQTRHSGMISCCFGKTRDVLPDLIQSLGAIDFLFHDAGHSREDFVFDFEVANRKLGPGAIVLFDDIRWEDPKGTFYEGPSHTYEGWRQIVSNPRVRRAIEIDGALGLVLLR